MKAEKTQTSLLKVLRNKRGQSLVEYALIIVVVAVAAIAAVRGMTNQVNTTFSNVTTKLQNGG